jgi:hypothetical protein
MSLPQNQQKPWNPPASLEELDAKIEEMAAELNENERLELAVTLDRWAARLVASVKGHPDQAGPYAAPAPPALVLCYPVPPRPESTGIPRAKPRISARKKPQFRGVFIRLSRDCADELRSYARVCGVAFDTFLRFMVTRTSIQYRGQFGTGYLGLSHLTTAQCDKLKATYGVVCRASYAPKPERN